MRTLTVVSLRTVLVVVLLGAVLAQVLVPITATALGDQYAEVEHLVVPYSVAAVLAITCAEVALLMIWRLLSLVRADAIFTVRALRWVDVITICIGIATATAAGVTVHLVGIVQTGGPGVALALIGCVVLGLALTLLMVVMRSLLVAAIAHRGELDTVI
ncbi:DUF2975 domain-containing protein [Sanguibacter antarcticus]|uniref:DUF2975 family protein n=1 Tax=Sanguibacter antarcticus TaxID=372484 RepID=A0A2A9E928_9MICO|nr:DUF2975 domain-containing protein [Sanguibacter antarcticus]PFG35186.1 Protein of unknown function (DUF2975) [Sanguibacter antarcticus]